MAGAHPLFALIMHSMLETTELHEHGYNNANKVRANPQNLALKKVKKKRSFLLFLFLF